MKRRTIVRWGIATLVLLLAPVAFLVVYSVVAVEILCNTVVQNEVRSPAGSRIAFNFDQGCGVGSSIETEVAVTNGTPFKDHGFFLGSTPSFLVTDGDYRGDTELEWVGEDKLVIRLPKEAKIERNDPVEGVEVEIVRD